MKKAFASGLLAALVLIPAAGTHSVKEGGTFRVGMWGVLFDTIDAALADIAGETHVLGATCAGLMRAAPSSSGGVRVVPEIAAGYPEVTEGGRKYRFLIRSGLRFSTGSPVTARDVAHTINRALDPALKAYVAGWFEDIVGARDVLTGKAAVASGVAARRNTVTISLTKPLGDLLARTTLLCVVPETLPADPEGAKAPVPSAGPYYVAEYDPGRQVVLERNRFYRGSRPRHVDRFVIDLTADSATILDRVESGELDYGWVPTADFADRARRLARTYGINKSRFFVAPIPFLRLFVLNTQRPLFKNNVLLRQAVNFAVDRKALLRERGPLAGYVTDQYLTPGLPGYRNERIYPLAKPDLARARTLAKGHTRSGKAILYVPAFPLGIAQGQILKSNLRKIGIAIEIKQFPAPGLFFAKLGAPRAAFDIGWLGWLADLPDPSMLNDLFDGRRLPSPNYSRFNSATYNRRFDRAVRLTGEKRYREYGNLDVDLAANAAPAIAYAYDNALTLVGPRTGCVVVSPYLDLAAVCLK